MPEEFFPGTPHIFGGSGVYIGCTGLTKEMLTIVADGETMECFTVEEIAEEDKTHLNGIEGATWLNSNSDVSLTIDWKDSKLCYQHVDHKLTLRRMCALLANVLDLDTENISTESPFEDVPSTDPDYGAIMAVYTKLLIFDSNVRMDVEVTKAQIATLLSRVIPKVKDATITAELPTDVTSSHWAADGILRVLSIKAMEVYGDGSFRLNEVAMESQIHWDVLR